MKNYIYILIIFLFITNCTLNKVINNHGVNFLDKKEKKLKINTSNRNDILKLLGPPSTKSSFKEDIWIYIERKTSSSKLLKLGKRELIKNNVLVLEVNTRGVLIEKIFLTKDDIEKINFDKQVTSIAYSKDSFIYNFLSATRQKISDPLGKKKITNK
jgi:outer membrane protein assembly factor BamE (lipoprotein component of BamABCDE complex)